MIRDAPEAKSILVSFVFVSEVWYSPRYRLTNKLRAMIKISVTRSGISAAWFQNLMKIKEHSEGYGSLFFG